MLTGTNNESCLSIFNLEKNKKVKILYKVKWKGYPYSECTWEERKNLKNLYKKYFYKADLEFE